MKLYEAAGNKYISFTTKERLWLILRALLVMAVLNYFFYRTLWAFIPLLAAGAGYLRLKYTDELDAKRRKVKEEFKELLLLSSTGLRAGYSIENAMLGSFKDLSKLYGSGSAVCVLLKDIAAARRNNRSISEVFKSAGVQMGIEDIEEFGFVYEIAYKKSGNLTEIMDKTSAGIIEKLDAEEAVYLSLSERQFEMKIMSVMPFILMLYISLTNRGYFDGLYHSVKGMAVMSAALIIYILAYGWSVKISRIKV